MKISIIISVIFLHKIIYIHNMSMCIYYWVLFFSSVPDLCLEQRSASVLPTSRAQPYKTTALPDPCLTAYTISDPRVDICGAPCPSSWTLGLFQGWALIPAWPFSNFFPLHFKLELRVGVPSYGGDSKMLYFLIHEESQSDVFTSHSLIFILLFMKLQKNGLTELPHHMQMTFSLLILSQSWISQQLTQSSEDSEA